MAARSKWIALAMAASFGVPSAAAQAQQPSWTGFYIGGNAGIATAQTRGSSLSSPFPAQIDDHGRGFAGGAQAGINWQFAPNWVVGLEGDIGRLGIDRTSAATFEYESGLKTGTYGTLRGRLGYAAGPTLIYVTGGAAFVKTTEDWNFLGNRFLPSPPESHSASRTANGGTYGAGIETMLGSNWTARTEYLFINAGKSSTQVIHADTAEPSSMQFDQKFHVFRFGLNYLFGSSTPSAAIPTADWNGVYLGLNAGRGMSLATGSSATVIDKVNVNGIGFAGGLQAGYNWQFAERFVAGVEADINHLGLKRSYQRFPIGQSTFEVEYGWFSTVRGRVGYAAGPALIYATAGFAVAEVANTMDFNGSAEISTMKRRATGAVFGGGIEAALGGHWSARLEYLNVDLGGRSKVEDKSPIYNFDDNFQVVRFGLNYKFGTPIAK